jgi:hypothetical protein
MEHAMDSMDDLKTFFLKRDAKLFEMFLKRDQDLRQLKIRALRASLEIYKNPQDEIGQCDHALAPTNLGELRPASRESIDKMIRKEYDRAEKSGDKPPNVKEIIKPVQESLREEGLYASGSSIQDLAGKKYKNRRRKPGATLASERRKGK